jgi:hypothetical protein
MALDGAPTLSFALSEPTRGSRALLAGQGAPDAREHPEAEEDDDGGHTTIVAERIGVRLACAHVRLERAHGAATGKRQ